MKTHSIRRVRENDGPAVQYPLAFHMVSDRKALGAVDSALLLGELASAVDPCGPKLVELFFSHVQPCFPILHRQLFLERYNSSRDTIDCALLAAVYLISLHWWSYDPELSVRRSPESALLRSVFRRAIDSSYHRPKLAAVQAMLLYLQCQPEDPLNPDHTYAWGLTCQVLAIGQCIGLHLDPSEWSIPLWEINVRKRVSWALFMQDRWTALAYGRPVHIQMDDWAVEELTKADFIDSASDRLDEDSWLGKSHMQFILMAQLTQILSETLSSFYTVRASLDQDTSRLYIKAQPLIARLREWHSNLPSVLSLDIVYQRKLNFHGEIPMHFRVKVWKAMLSFYPS